VKRRRGGRLERGGQVAGVIEVPRCLFGQDRQAHRRATVGKRRCWRIDVNSATCAKQERLFDPMSNPHCEEA
jgi:hypothetical protein